MLKIPQQPSEIPRTSKTPGGILNRTTDLEYYGYQFKVLRTFDAYLLGRKRREFDTEHGNSPRAKNAEHTNHVTLLFSKPTKMGWVVLSPVLLGFSPDRRTFKSRRSRVLVFRNFWVASGDVPLV